MFGSKDALVVALGIRAFELLSTQIDALPRSDDPAADLVEAGVQVFRGFAIEHPALFEVGFHAGVTDSIGGAGFRPEAEHALDGLTGLVARLDERGLLGTHTIREATAAFHALCEGLAALELRSSFLVDGGAVRWRRALTALVQGFAVT